jgi:hypothetical protein
LTKDTSITLINYQIISSLSFSNSAAVKESKITYMYVIKDDPCLNVYGLFYSMAMGESKLGQFDPRHLNYGNESPEQEAINQ